MGHGDVPVRAAVPTFFFLDYRGGEWNGAEGGDEWKTKVRVLGMRTGKGLFSSGNRGEIFRS